MNRGFAPETGQHSKRLSKLLIFVPLLCVLLFGLACLLPPKSLSSDTISDDQNFTSNPDLFLIEPSILLDTNPEVYRKWFPSKELNFHRDDNVLTYGTFRSDLSFSSFNNISSIETVLGEGPIPSRNLLLHYFIATNAQIIHVVVFHKVENYLWVGEIPQNVIKLISDKHNVTLENFGLYEQVFDLFNVNENHMPDEIGHFLGQIATSRYLACTKASETWAVKNDIKDDPEKTEALHASLKSMKSLMKALQFEFWIMSGTLLGWYRECSVIPYTSDADYGSWATSLAGKNYSSTFFESAKKHGLNLKIRFGEPTMTQEFSFTELTTGFKNDLFLIYPNGTHFRAPYHIISKKRWTYLVYPKFELCSAVLLGEKILVPCTPEDVLQMEYTKDWNVPVTEDNYAVMNAEPLRPFNFNVSHYTIFPEA